MLPARVLELDSMPRTANGKVGWSVLKGRARRILTAGVAGRPVESDTEKLVRDVIAAVTGWELADADANFFQLGGDSLLAMRAVSRLHATTGVELTIRDVFDCPSVALLAERVEGSRGKGSTLLEAPELPPPAANDGGSTTLLQDGLWFLARLDPNDAAYVETATHRIRGELDVERFRRAILDLADRHEALRSYFPSSGGRPVQTSLAATDIPVDLVDLTSLAGNARRARMARSLREAAAKPINVTREPVFRVLAVKLHERDWVIQLAIHHIACDDWSVDVIRRELGTLYRSGSASSSLPRLRLAYADFARWQRAWQASASAAAQLEFWKSAVENLPPAIQWPATTSNARSTAGGMVRMPLPAASLTLLADHWRSHGYTVFMGLLALYAIALSTMTGTDEVIIGSPVSIRSFPELEDLVGLFVNTLPFRISLSDDMPLTELVGAVRTRAVEVYANRDLPFPLIARAVASKATHERHVIHQAVFVLREGETPLDIGGGPASEIHVHNGTAKFDLTLFASVESSEPYIALEHRKAVIARPRAAHLLRDFVVLVERAAGDPRSTVRTLRGAIGSHGPERPPS
jgi:acyl carrier protein